MRKIMKNNKGFTLTELLATIVILAVVVLIATPAVIGVSNLIKNNMWDSKRKLIEQSAKLYGEDGGTGCVKINVLCEKGYVKADEGLDDTQCLENPKDGTKLGGHYVKIEEQGTSKRIKATYKGTSCS